LKIEEDHFLKTTYEPPMWKNQPNQKSTNNLRKIKRPTAELGKFKTQPQEKRKGPKNWLDDTPTGRCPKNKGSGTRGAFQRGGGKTKREDSSKTKTDPKIGKGGRPRGEKKSSSF